MLEDVFISFVKGIGLLAMNHDNCSKPGFVQPGDHRRAADREYSFEVMILDDRDFCDFRFQRGEIHNFWVEKS